MTALLLAALLSTSPATMQVLDQLAGMAQRARCYDRAADEMLAADIQRARAARGSAAYRAAGARWLQGYRQLLACRTGGTR